MNETYGKAGRARNLLRAALAVDGFVLFIALCAATNNNGGLAWLLLLSLAVLTVLALRYATKQGYWFVRRIERTWKQVCAGLGGNFVGEGNDYLASVREGVRSGGRYYVATQTKVMYPQLKNVRGNDQAWTAEVRFFDGQTIEDYNKHADAFALAYSVPFVSFDLAEENGLIRIRAGKMPVPAEYVYQAIQRPADTAVSPRREQRVKSAGTSATDRRRQRAQKAAANSQDDFKLHLLEVMRESAQAAAVNSSVTERRRLQVKEVAAHSQPAALAYERALLKSVPMAVDIEGKVWLMPIEGQHVLIAARTGGGKGSFIWTLVLRLEPAFRAGLVKFWGCDPKRLELAIGRDWWEHYADTDVGMVELLEQAVSEMFEVGSQLKGVSRRFTPSPQKTPLNVVVIDELGYLSSLLTDRKLQTRADNAIKTLLTQGRSNGYAVVGCCQDVRKSTVEYRDLFPIRICGGLNEGKMVDLVLGEGVHDAGATCEQIPLGREGAGVAYVLDAERAMKPRMVRAAWVSNKTIRNALAPNVRAQAEAYEVQDE